MLQLSGLTLLLITVRKKKNIWKSFLYKMGIRQFKACLDTLNVGFEYKPKTSKNDIPLIFSGCIEISIGEVAVFAESKAFIYTKFVCQ